MYAWLWRRLPGPTAVRFVLALALVAAVVYLLMESVFPWVEQRMPYSDVAVS